MIFDDQAVFDDVIDTVATGEAKSFIDDWQTNLVLEMQAGLGEFVIEAGIARAFKHTGTQNAVHLQPRTNDDATGLVCTHVMS